MKKFYHKHNRKIWVLFLLTLVIAIFSLSFLPERLPIHFDIQGVPDNYAGKWSIFLAPAVILVLIFLAEFLRKYDPKSRNYDKFEYYYYEIHFAVSLLMAFIQLYTIAYISDWQINIRLLMPTIVGLLFIFLGNILAKFKHNYFVGIRNSWTLASEKVWYQTHRFAGKVFVLGGFLLIIMSFLFPNHLLFIFIGVILLLVFLPTAASFYYYQKDA